MQQNYLSKAIILALPFFGFITILFEPKKDNNFIITLFLTIISSLSALVYVVNFITGQNVNFADLQILNLFNILLLIPSSILGIIFFSILHLIIL